jgi:protein-S-isoprenylcysteine O-methyltransferase Ste14
VSTSAKAPASSFLENQGFHLLAGVVSGLLLAWAARFDVMSSGSLWGWGTPAWYWLAAAVPVIHQAYVMVIWRWQLVLKGPTQLLGNRAFPLYGAIFMVLFALRLVTIIVLAMANRGSLSADPRLLNGLALVVAVPSFYVLYSVGRYFGLRRALGADHFDPAYRGAPLEKRGAFRFVNNAMYVAGLAALYLPGLIWGSAAALLLAAFNHAYVWVHYFTTEKPDMRVIYGPGPGQD